MSFKNIGLLMSFWNLIPLLICSAIIWYYYRNSTYSEKDKYHTFWPRFWTYTIDGLILYPVTVIVFYIQLNNIFDFKALTILSFIEPFTVYLTNQNPLVFRGV